MKLAGELVKGDVVSFDNGETFKAVTHVETDERFAPGLSVTFYDGTMEHGLAADAGVLTQEAAPAPAPTQT